MATGYIVLPLPGGFPPDGTTDNVAATPEKIKSTGTLANAPSPHYTGLLFDPTTDEHWLWAFTLPGDYASGGTLRLTFSNKGVSANQVRWKAGIACGVLGTTDMDTVAFAAADAVSATPSTTTGITTQTTIALTMTNAAANRPAIVFIGRDPGHADDTNASDMRLEGLTFEYTTS